MDVNKIRDIYLENALNVEELIVEALEAFPRYYFDDDEEAFKDWSDEKINKFQRILNHYHLFGDNEYETYKNLSKFHKSLRNYIEALKRMEGVIGDTKVAKDLKIFAERVDDDDLYIYPICEVIVKYFADFKFSEKCKR